MRIIPHSLAAACLPGFYYALVYRRLPVWMVIYVVWQYVAGMAGNQGRCAAYAVIAAMIIGIVIVIAQGDVSQLMLSLNPFSPLILPLIFLCSQPERCTPPFSGDDGIAKAPGIAAMKAAGYSAPVSPLMYLLDCWHWFFPLSAFIPSACGNHRGYLPKPGSASG